VLDSSGGSKLGFQWKHARSERGRPRLLQTVSRRRLEIHVPRLRRRSSTGSAVHRRSTEPAKCSRR